MKLPLDLRGWGERVVTRIPEGGNFPEKAALRAAGTCSRATQSGWGEESSSGISGEMPWYYSLLTCSFLLLCPSPNSKCRSDRKEVSWYTLSVRKKQGKVWAEIWRGKQRMQGIVLKRIKHSFKDILTSCVQLFGTPWTVVCQAPLFIGFSRQEYWSGLLLPPPGDFPNPGIEPKSLASLHWQADFLPLYHLGSPCIDITRLHDS